MHGQGLTNSIFLPQESLLVELAHPSYASRLSRRNGDEDADVQLGFQPMAVAQGRYYLSAAVATSPCSALGWKFDPACASHVDVPELSRALRQYASMLAEHLQRIPSNERPNFVRGLLDGI